MFASLLPTDVINSGLSPVICRYKTIISGNNGVINGYKSVINSHNITADFRCYFSQTANGKRFANSDLAKKALYSPSRRLAFCRGSRDTTTCKPFR